MGPYPTHRADHDDQVVDGCYPKGPAGHEGAEDRSPGEAARGHRVPPAQEQAGDEKPRESEEQHHPEAAPVKGELNSRAVWEEVRDQNRGRGDRSQAVEGGKERRGGRRTGSGNRHYEMVGSFMGIFRC